MTPLPPGSTLGILGSGQLGRMLALAAAPLGYRVHIYAPATGPANDVACGFTQGGYADAAALTRFAEAVDVITYEFENVDPSALETVAALRPVRPSPRSLAVARYRVEEKMLARSLGGLTAPFRPVADLAGLRSALAQLGTPAILKTSRFGYDGRGQVRIGQPGEAEAAWTALGITDAERAAGSPAVLERRVDFSAEFSVLLCRGLDGRSLVWAVPENEHRDGILARSTVPASGPVQAVAAGAVALTRRIADALDHVGLLTAEYFATDGGALFNEMAPRVHNSGHWTIEGAATSQFENHVRAVCGLPLGPTLTVAAEVRMDNLLGAEVESWPAILAEPDAHLHLYGKRRVSPGRKMGHVTRLRRA